MIDEQIRQLDDASAVRMLRHDREEAHQQFPADAIGQETDVDSVILAAALIAVRHPCRRDHSAGLRSSQAASYHFRRVPALTAILTQSRRRNETRIQTKTQTTKPKVALTANAWWAIDKTRLPDGLNTNIESALLLNAWKMRSASCNATKPWIKIIPQKSAHPFRLQRMGVARINAVRKATYI